jgi:hypothetical protein
MLVHHTLLEFLLKIGICEKIFSRQEIKNHNKAKRGKQGTITAVVEMQ